MTKHFLTLMTLTCGLAFLATLQSEAEACETPVYRYSMYKWEPAPYTIYYIHEGDSAAAEPLVAAVNALNEAATGPTANLWCVPVDLSSDPELRTVPPPVADAWAMQSDKSTPRCLVMSPKGDLVSDEMLTPDDLPAMVDSPVRQQIATELEAGKVGVLLLLESGDTAANERARMDTQAFLAALTDGAAGLLLPTGPPGFVPEPDSPAARVEVGFVSVDRDDPAEAWLVRMLLVVEDDLAHLDSPMVFGMFGRGRALEPSVGLGIIRENLAEAIDFIRGDCSCTVRDQNPGLDLLTYYDWEKAASIMADRFGSEEGNSQHLGPGSEFAIDFILPEIRPLEPIAGGSDQAPVRVLSPETLGGSQETTDTAEGGTAIDLTVETTPADETEEAVATDSSSDSTRIDLADSEEVAVGDEGGGRVTGGGAGEDATFTGGVLWTMFIGVGVGLVLLLSATFFLFRPTA